MSREIQVEVDAKPIADFMRDAFTVDAREGRPGISDWQTFMRQTPLELAQEGDGRTLTGRVVPYNVTATVADPPHFTPYKESFRPGAFRAQLAAANRIDVLLNYAHRQGISDVVGRGVSLDDRPDGLYGTFRVLDHPDGDKALELYHAGVLTGLSTEFSARKSRTVDGVVQRVDARIGNVALCRPFGSTAGGAAYQGAEVLAVRATQSEMDADAILRQIEAAAQRYMALEPDPTDKAAMRDILKAIRALLAEEETEGASPGEVTAAADAATSKVGRTSELMERLAALGVEPLLSRAVTRIPWDGSAARFTDEEYQRSCLIDRGGDAPVKERCSLPVLEPNGDLNVNALGSAAAALRGARGGLANVSADQKMAAARKLARYYRQAGMTPPAGMQQMMGGGQ